MTETLPARRRRLCRADDPPPAGRRGSRGSAARRVVQRLTHRARRGRRVRQGASAPARASTSASCSGTRPTRCARRIIDVLVEELRRPDGTPGAHRPRRHRRLRCHARRRAVERHALLQPAQGREGRRRGDGRGLADPLAGAFGGPRRARPESPHPQAVPAADDRCLAQGGLAAEVPQADGPRGDRLRRQGHQPRQHEPGSAVEPDIARSTRRRTTPTSPTARSAWPSDSSGGRACPTSAGSSRSSSPRSPGSSTTSPAATSARKATPSSNSPMR